MVDQITERIDGYHGRYTDRLGASCHVRGTYAVGVPLSWVSDSGDYMVICGHDQRRLVDTAERVMIKPLVRA